MPVSTACLCRSKESRGCRAFARRDEVDDAEESIMCLPGRNLYFLRHPPTTQHMGSNEYLTGLMKWLKHPEWAAGFQDILQEHIGVVCEAVDLE
jgi:hypothetical protein